MTLLLLAAHRSRLVTSRRIRVTTTLRLAAIIAMVLLSPRLHAQEPPKPVPEAAPPVEQPATKPPPPKPAPKPAAASTLTLEVTDQSGNAVPDVAVAVTGPVERSGATGEKGAVAFRTMRAGTYRIRFEHERFVTLEREVVVRAGQPATVSVALTSAAGPVEPTREPATPPEPPTKPDLPPPSPVLRDVEPRTLSIPDFLDKNLIGGEPQKTTLLGCANGGTARLLQIRDPLENQEHADVDELLYVVAGSGVLRIRSADVKVGPGFFALVPRGVPHSLRRQGRNPLIAMSVLAGAPCVEGDQ